MTDSRFSGGFYSENAAASVAGVGLRELHQMAAAKTIRSIRSNGAVLYAKEDIRTLRDTRPMSNEERKLREIFVGKAESRAEIESMAAANGHHISRENQPKNPGETAYSRMVCSCGWASSWLVNSLATDEKRKHLKDAALA